jgi:hypothetical protein
LFAVFLDLWPVFGLVAVISSLVSRRGKRVGDVVAGTIVVQERVAARAAEPPAMPPELAGWAATVDLSALPDDLALAARQFLARAPQLSPAPREQLGASLVRAIGQYIGPPPRGVPGWAYLSAVLAERRRRDEARLLGGRQDVGTAPTASPAPVPQAPPSGRRPRRSIHPTASHHRRDHSTGRGAPE